MNLQCMPRTIQSIATVSIANYQENKHEFFQQLGTNSPLGTLAYVIQEQALLVRVNNGWQYVAVSNMF